MLTIIIGHIIGISLPLFIFRNISIIGSDSGEKAVTSLFLFALALFLEYQLFRSIKMGTIYFRGQVDELNESRFKSCQFSYSILSGAIFVILLQNILQ